MGQKPTSRCMNEGVAEIVPDSQPQILNSFRQNGFGGTYKQPTADLIPPRNS